MSDLIMTLSDDEDLDQSPQSRTTAAVAPPAFLTAEQRIASRQKANKLPTGIGGANPATSSAPPAKKAVSLAQQLADAERDDGEERKDGRADDDDDDDFEMGGTVEPVAAAKPKAKAPAKKAPVKKRSAAVAELDQPEDDDEALPAAGSFAWDVEATSDVLTAKLIPAPSKVFEPYIQHSGTSLQSKIAKQLEKRQAKEARKKRKDGSDSEGSSSEDDTNSEADSEEDLDEDDEDAPEEQQNGGDQVDSDVDMHEYKDDEVKKKFSSSAKPSGPKVIQATQLPTPKQAIKDFASLRLSRPLLRAVGELGWAAPTPVQSQSILPAVAGKDLLVNAQTGSGKTGAFMLPILERLLYRPKRVPLSRVLVLLPTRELAAQCHEVSQQLARHTDIRICLVVGGLSEKVQEQELRAKPDIILATPGRLIDHLRNTANVHLEDIEILVLDEADRLLECGFAEELTEIIKECPKGRQTLLFSATLTDHVVDLINLSLNDPVRIKIDAYESLVENLTQEFVRIRDRPSERGEDKEGEKEREAIILSLAKRSFRTKTIIFMQSKQQCHRMSIIFGLAKLKAAELQGNQTQTQRLESLEAFRTGAVDFLLCTDLAARGLDIPGVETVLNMSMPRELRQYIHRVGRTARAGRTGRAVTLVGEGQRGALKELVKKARDVVHSRTIPPAILLKFRSLIRDMEGSIREVFDMEMEEKAARIAEMEANKAANTMVHHEEIMNRPAKTWFQTPEEKLKAKAAGVKQFWTKDDEKKAQEEEEAKKPKLLTPKQLARAEARLAKEKSKTALLGLSRAKKRRKLMAMEDEKAAKEAAREAKKHDKDDLRSQSLPDVLPPMSLAESEKLQRVLGKKAKKERAKEKQEELGITDQQTRRRELQAQQLMAVEKKKKLAAGGGVISYDDSGMPSALAAASSSKKLPKETHLSGSNFRYKERSGTGDDRFKIPHRKFKEEQAARKKGEASAKPSDKKKGTQKAHHAFKSQSKFKRSRK